MDRPVGRPENGTEGSYKIRFKDNRNGWDCAYPAAELLPDHTLVCTTYGHFDKGELPYILSVRFKSAIRTRWSNNMRGTITPRSKMTQEREKPFLTPMIRTPLIAF